MKIVFNNLEIVVLEKIDLYTFLSTKALENKTGIAVAVNGAIIPKLQWANHVLKDEDQLVLITATAGG